MSFWGWLTGGTKIVDDVFDKDKGLISQVGGWIGNMNLTDEEVMEANGKTVASVQDFVVKTLDEKTERSKSRREIANLIIKTYLMWFTVALGIWPLNKEYAIFIMGALGGIAIGGAFTAVVIFHFGSHGLARFKSVKKG
ncbi:MAG: hypothetical protein V3R25_05965 [Nitrosomonadaceae bacterium]